MWRIRITPGNLAAVADLAARAGEVNDPAGALTGALAATVPFTLPTVDTVDVPGTASVDLRVHQAQVVAAVQGGVRRVLLADEPGLGKTASALVSIAAAAAYPAVVVCPAVVKINWARECERWTPGLSVAVLAGRKADPGALAGADLVVVNYDVLTDWAHALAALRPRAVVLDEAHYIKDFRSKRGKAAQTLCAAVPPDGVVMALTGTPVPNRVIDLAGPLHALGWLDTLGGFWGFAKRYCAATQTSYGWDLTGSSNIAELHTTLREMGLVRRVKADVADLPARTIVDLPVSLKADGARDVRAAQKALVTLLADLVRQAAKGDEGKPRKVTKTLVRQVVTVALADRSSGAGAALMALRRTLGTAKVPLIADQARAVAEGGGKVVVFAHHRDVQDAVAAALADLGVVRITGDQNPHVRQAAVDAFQSDPNARVCVASMKAAGVGITLHAASQVVVGELPWTAADQDQAVDRVHRIGQDQPVTAWRVIAEGTLDARMADLIASKAAVASAVVDGLAADPTGAEDEGSRVTILTALVVEALKVTADGETDGIAEPVAA